MMNNTRFTKYAICFCIIIFLTVGGEGSLKLVVAGELWRLIDSNPLVSQIVADGNTLYEFRSDNTIYQSTGTPISGWQSIGYDPAIIQIAASGGNLYRLHNTGTIFKYVGSVSNWQMLSDGTGTMMGGREIVADGNNLYAYLNPIHDMSYIMQYTGTPITGWQQLFRNDGMFAKSIAASGGNLYQLDTTGVLKKYPGYQILDNNLTTISIVASGNNLYKLDSNGNVFEYIENNSFLLWTK